MIFLSFLLAWRFVKNYHYSTIATMIKICSVSIVLGTFALALTLSIMQGFEQATCSLLQTIHPQIIMTAHGDELDYEAIAARLKNNSAIQALSPYSRAHAIVQSDTVHDISHIVMVQGINPQQEQLVTSFAQKIITPHQSLESALRDNHVIIGKALAQSLTITAGALITLLVAPDEFSGTFTKINVFVMALFSTGIEDIDQTVVLCSLDFMKHMLPENGITQINIKLAPHADETQEITRLRDQFGLEVYPWTALYPALVSALKLEKYVMIILLALITLVASMNIISLIFMQIQHKRNDRALLSALGMPGSDIQNIFMIIAMAITSLSAFIGCSVAYGVAYLLNTYPCISLPDVYYVSHVPVVLDWHIFALVFFMSCFLGYCATRIGLYRTKKITIIQELSS